MKPSFWQVARQPKWVGGLLIAIAIAVLFAMFGNWQLSRSIRVTPTDTSLDKTIALTELAKPSSSFLDLQADRHVKTIVFVAPSHCAVIADRHQLLEDGTTKPGFWTVFDTLDQSQGLNPHLFVASAFFETYEQAADSCAKASLNGLAFDTAIEVTGRYEPSEAPERQTLNDVAKFETLSVEQLINYWPLKSPSTYGGFVISDRMLAPATSDGGEPITSSSATLAERDHLLKSLLTLSSTDFNAVAGFSGLAVVATSIPSDNKSDFTSAKTF